MKNVKVHSIRFAAHPFVVVPGAASRIIVGSNAAMFRTTTYVANLTARSFGASGIRFASTFKSAYDKTVAERAAMGIVPKPLDPKQCADLVSANSSSVSCGLTSCVVPPMWRC